MTTVQRTEVDGVPCFWVDSGRPTLSASLLFRAGKVDEKIETSGWLHLLEHMALHDSPFGGALGVNGSVSLFTTSFDCHGPPEAVVRHLNATTDWLREPRLDGLVRERGVLQAEARMRSGEVLDALLNRYGARGPGLSGIPEFGIGRANEEGLRTLAGASFTLSNAALVLDGAPPASLHFDLPEGDGIPPLPPAVPCALQLPSAYADQRGIIASGTADRTVGATLLPALIQHALRDELRQRGGAAYAPWAHYEAVDNETAVLFAGSDVAEQIRPASIQTAARIIEDVAAVGPNAEHLADICAATVQSMLDPYNAPTFALRAAQRHIQGLEPETPETVVDGIREVRTEEILDAAISMRRTALYGADPSADFPEHVAPLRRKVVPSVRGKRFRHRNWPASRDVLALGHLTTQIAFGEHAIEVRQKELAGLAIYPDGRRMLVDRDAWSITVDPAEWHRGDRAVAQLERWVPAELHLPQAGGQTPRPFRRISLWKRWWTPAAEAFRRNFAWVLVCALILLGVIAAVVFASKLNIGGLGAVVPLIILFRLVIGGSGRKGPPRDSAWSRFGDS